VTVRHLLKNPTTGRLSYRRPYPLELRPHIPGNAVELKRSLRAKRIEDPGAWSLYQAAHAEYEAIVAKSRKVLEGRFDTLDPPKIVHLAAIFEHERLAANDAMRRTGNMRGLELQENGYEEWLSEFHGWQRSGNLGEIVEYWESEAGRLLASQNIDLDPADPDRLDDLCYALNTAAIRVGTECLARLKGKGTIDTPETPQRPPEGLVEAPAARPSSLPFDALSRAYMDNKRMAVSASTKESIRTALRYLEEVHSKPTPEAITRSAVAQWLDLMSQRPASLPRDERGLPLPLLASRYRDSAAIPRMSAATQEKYCGALSKCWAQLQNRGEIPANITNPFRGHSITALARPAAPSGLTVAEMQAIFNTPIFTAGERPKGGRGEASYWIPLILLWTGARPEEVAQLLVTDIYQDDSTSNWLIRFTDEGQHPTKPLQALKTSRYGTGRRAIPVPKTLLDLGLIGYVKHLKAAGETALFPKLTLKNKQRGDLFACFGAWWPGYISKAGVRLNGKRPAREFRHCWTTAARACEVPKDAREYIQGHSADKGSTNDHYGDREPLGEHIHNVTFKGLDLSRVLPWEPSNAS
jgi:integrase